MKRGAFQILEADGLVLGRADLRPAYEPKAARKHFRDELRRAVLALRPRPGSRLYASDASEDDAYCDLENLFCYNFGAAQLHHLCENGFVLERAPANDLPTSQTHEVLYSLRRPDESPNPWRRGPKLASWSFDCERLDSETKATRVWYACRSGAATCFVPRPHSGPVGIDLTLCPAKGKSLRPASVIKPLADGILAAFHGHDGSSVDDLVARLARQIGIRATAESVHALLTDDSRNAMGSRRLVRPYRETVQWNPEDERLVQIIVRVGEPDDTCRCLGTLYALEQEPRASAEFTPRERLAVLASFLAALERPDFTFGSWWNEPRAAPQYCVSDEAQRLYAEIYRFGWIRYDFDWSARSETPDGKRLTENVAAIAGVGIDELAKLLTLHVCADRFCEGQLAGTYESGHLNAIVRRAKELLESIFVDESPTTPFFASDRAPD